MAVLVVELGALRLLAPGDCVAFIILEVALLEEEVPAQLVETIKLGIVPPTVFPGVGDFVNRGVGVVRGR